MWVSHLQCAAIPGIVHLQKLPEAVSQGGTAVSRQGGEHLLHDAAALSTETRLVHGGPLDLLGAHLLSHKESIAKLDQTLTVIQGLNVALTSFSHAAD